jgi:hypothetical protein
MRYYWLILGTLAVWRVTHLLTGEDGPWKLLARFRRLLGSGFWGELLDCFYCLSVWVAAPLAWLLGVDWKERLLLWPALSAGAILLERITAPRETPVAPYIEESEGNDGLLRRDENASERKPAGQAG